MSPSLSALQNPNLSLPLFLLGLFLLYLEFNVPGRVLPAALGTLLLALTLNALHHTPLLPWALALTLASIALILLTLWVPEVLHLTPGSFARNLPPALLTLLLAYALFRLTDVPNALRRVHPLTAILTSAAFTVVTLTLGRIALLARRNKRIR